MTELTKFFTALSERARKENDLSDITYAMCEANLEFRKFFLDFFFREANLDVKTVKISREHSTEWGRPDFWIRTADGLLYIVEVKIWDSNHHFEQYFEILNSDEGCCGNGEGIDSAWKRLGYIANYKIEHNVTGECGTEVNKGENVCELCVVQTWREFQERLEKQRQLMEDRAIQAYAKYLRSVCPFDDFKLDADWQVNPNDFVKIRMFVEAIHTALADVGGKVYSRRKGFCSKWHIGEFFELPMKDGPVWGWCGACYDSDRKGAYASVEFEDRDGWGRQICSQYKRNVKDDVLDLYLGLGDIELDSFGERLKKVLLALKKGNSVSGCVDFALGEKRLSTLYAMKCLPYAIENAFADPQFISTIESAGYQMVISDERDAESQEGWCGRYINLTHTEPGRPSFQWWTGIIFAEDYMLDKSQRESKRAPLFVLEVNHTIAGEISGWTDDSQGWRAKAFDVAVPFSDVMKEVKNEIKKLIGC